MILWRAMPIDTTIAAKTWLVPAEQLPNPNDLEQWLYGMWARVHQWITGTLGRTAEPNS